MSSYRIKMLLNSIVIFLSMLSGLTYAKSDFVKGNGAWFYGQKAIWFEQIKNHNKNTCVNNKIRYLFPKAGDVTFNQKTQTIQVKYDKTISKRYKTKTNLTVMPIIRGRTKRFNNWQKADYVKAAHLIADSVLADNYADGIELDLEPYHPSHLPFYRALAKRLKDKDKMVAAFVKADDVTIELYQALGDNGFVILYGYDLAHQNDDNRYPVPPTVYKKRFKKAIKKLIEVSQKAKGYFMIGIPAVATVHEWEKIKVRRNGKMVYRHNSFKLDDYFRKALNEVSSIKEPRYLGYSLWAFVASSKGQKYMPLVISKNEWQMMKYCNK